jgi:hypothetical protein
MRFRFTQLVCLLLLLSNPAFSEAHIDSVQISGSAFVSKLLLRIAVEDAEPANAHCTRKESPVFAALIVREERGALPVRGPVVHATRVHAVTGSSL